MNKQELIKKLKELLTTPSELEGYDFNYGHDFGIERAIALAEQLDSVSFLHLFSKLPRPTKVFLDFIFC